MKVALIVVAALAVGGGVWWFVAGSGESANPPEACVSPPELYGTPPAGYSYSALDAQGERELLRDLNAEAIGVSDARPAIREDAPEERAGRDVRWLDYGEDGAAAAAFKDCHIVMVLGADERSIEPVAEAVFGPG